MAKPLFRCLVTARSFIKSSPSLSSFTITPFKCLELVLPPARLAIPFTLSNTLGVHRNLSHGTVNLVISEGKPKFETHELDPPKKEKWQTKKMLKMKRKREKEKRKAANRSDPRCLTVKRKRKPKVANAEERIKSKLERNFEQVILLHPIDTLSKKWALEKSKYEQSLESVRRFIAIAEKELELYYRHVALYGDPNNRDPLSILDSPSNEFKESENFRRERNDLSDNFSDNEGSETEDDRFEDDELYTSESDSLETATDSENDGVENSFETEN